MTQRNDMLMKQRDEKRDDRNWGNKLNTQCDDTTILNKLLKQSDDTKRLHDK